MSTESAFSRTSFGTCVTLGVAPPARFEPYLHVYKVLSLPVKQSKFIIPIWLKNQCRYMLWSEQQTRAGQECMKLPWLQTAYIWMQGLIFFFKLCCQSIQMSIKFLLLQTWGKCWFSHITSRWMFELISNEAWKIWYLN